MIYNVVLMNLDHQGERITLASSNTKIGAEELRKTWRKILGGKRAWTIDRRPGLDTLNHLALYIDTYKAEKSYDRG